MDLSLIYQVYKDISESRDQELKKIPVIWQEQPHTDSTHDPDYQVMLKESIYRIANGEDAPYELVDPRLFTKVIAQYGGEYLVMIGTEVGKVKLNMLSRVQTKVLFDLAHYYKEST